MKTKEQLAITAPTQKEGFSFRFDNLFFIFIFYFYDLNLRATALRVATKTLQASLLRHLNQQQERTMAKQKIETVRHLIYYSYANLAMAHTAIDKKQEKYEMFNFMIRAKLFKGLKDGTMNMRTIFDDEKIKLQTGQICNYCGSANKLALDHIFPQKLGGKDDAENLIFACRTCNSSKGKKDLMEWMAFRGQFLPLMIIRRYLKLTFNYCNENGLIDKQIDELIGIELPFRIDLLPTNFPRPIELTMNIDEKKNAL